MNIKAFKSMVWKAWEQNSYDIKSLSVVLLNSIAFFFPFRNILKRCKLKWDVKEIF